MKITIILVFLLTGMFIPCHAGEEKTLIEKAVEGSPDLKNVYSIMDILEKSSISTRIPIKPPVRCPYRISSKYGYRIHPITKERKFHSGIDVAVDLATPVYATGSGTVVFASRKGGYGRCVIIKHDYGYTSLYAHLIAYYVVSGAKVRQGDPIGFVGRTGTATGNHLHYEIRKNNRTINPEWYEYYRRNRTGDNTHYYKQGY